MQSPLNSSPQTPAESVALSAPQLVDLVGKLEREVVNLRRQVSACTMFDGLMFTIADGQSCAFRCSRQEYCGGSAVLGRMASSLRGPTPQSAPACPRDTPGYALTGDLAFARLKSPRPGNSPNKPGLAR